MTAEIEKFTPINGYEGIYEISESGKVRNVKTGKLLNGALTYYGYKTMVLTKGRKSKNHLLHRLIAETFIPNPNGFKVVNHINGIKTDNRIENLEWCTSSHNALHAIRTGLKVPVIGECTGAHKLKEEDVERIFKLKGKVSQYKLAIEYDVSRSTIKNIQNRINWTHVTDKFEDPVVELKEAEHLNKLREILNKYRYEPTELDEDEERETGKYLNHILDSIESELNHLKK